MGYTHYFEFEKSVDTFYEEVLEKIRKITNKYQDILQLEFDDESPELIKPNLIQFNGVGEDGHETFYLEPSTGFNFCKTARKPYDLPVCEVLLVLKDCYGERLMLNSDGFFLRDGNLDGEWELALRNVEKMFGITFDKDKLIKG